MTDLDMISDAQWLVLDLLAAAQRAGYPYVLRHQILESSKLPAGAKIQLTMAALLIPSELMRIENEHEFHLTEQGSAALALRFGQRQGEMMHGPTGIDPHEVLDLPEIGAKPN